MSGGRARLLQQKLVEHRHLLLPRPELQVREIELLRPRAALLRRHVLVDEAEDGREAGVVERGRLVVEPLEDQLDPLHGGLRVRGEEGGGRRCPPSCPPGVSGGRPRRRPWCRERPRGRRGDPARLGSGIFAHALNREEDMFVGR